MAERRSHPTLRCPDPDTWVDRYGDYLFRYALLRLRDRGEAEDLVQETLLAALRARSGFGGRCSFRTWLVAILKRKLVDQLRRSRHECRAADLRAPDEVLRHLFDHRGKWRAPPPTWEDPGEGLERAEFWDVFRRCLRRLPRPQADAFALRELEGLATPEVRALLRVTASNLGVLLHRARLRLWRCLTIHWFGNLDEET